MGQCRIRTGFKTRLSNFEVNRLKNVNLIFYLINYYFRVFTVFHYTKYFQGSESDPNLFFNGYVNTFLKLKLESTGYPPHIKTDNEKQQYIDEIQERENIQLNPENIKNNPQMKTISKLFLNSLYGYVFYNS